MSTSFLEAVADRSEGDAVPESVGYDQLDFPEARKKALKESFEQASNGGRMELRAVWEMMFTTAERAECVAPLPWSV